MSYRTGKQTAVLNTTTNVTVTNKKWTISVYLPYSHLKWLSWTTILSFYSRCSPLWNSEYYRNTSKHYCPCFTNSPNMHKIWNSFYFQLILSLYRLIFVHLKIWPVHNSPWTKSNSDKDTNKNISHCICSKWHLCKEARCHFHSCLWSAS